MSKLQSKVKLHFKFPLTFNDHTKVPDEKFIKAKNFFMDNYEALTISGTSIGYWTHSGMEYKDETVEYFVLIDKNKFLKTVKPKLMKQIKQFEKEFKQIEILCYYHNVIST